MVDLIALNGDEARTIANVSYDEEMPKKLLDECAVALTGCNPEMKIVISFGSREPTAMNNGCGDMLPLCRGTR